MRLVGDVVEAVLAFCVFGEFLAVFGKVVGAL